MFGFATEAECHEAVLSLNAHAKRLVRDPRNAGKRFRLILGEDRMSLTARQRRFLHGVVLMQVSEQARAGDRRYVMRVWKEYFRELFLGSTWETLTLPSGEVRTVEQRISSEELTVGQYATYIEQVIAHAQTELNVEFDFDEYERREREAIALRLIRQAQQRARATTREAEPA